MDDERHFQYVRLNGSRVGAVAEFTMICRKNNNAVVVSSFAFQESYKAAKTTIHAPQVLRICSFQLFSRVENQVSVPFMDSQQMNILRLRKHKDWPLGICPARNLLLSIIHSGTKVNVCPFVGVIIQRHKISAAIEQRPQRGIDGNK